MSLNDHRQPAPDYTDAFLWTFGVIIFMLLCTITAIAGYAWVAVTTLLLDRAITWIGHKRT
ncbi:MAG: hypothetical protein KC448_02075 [Yoonia sp.]|nr:hypothetical protein [Yoonia sp.]